MNIYFLISAIIGFVIWLFFMLIFDHPKERRELYQLGLLFIPLSFVIIPIIITYFLGWILMDGIPNLLFPDKD